MTLHQLTVSCASGLVPAWPLAANRAHIPFLFLQENNKDLVLILQGRWIQQINSNNITITITDHHRWTRSISQCRKVAKKWSDGDGDSAFIQFVFQVVLLCRHRVIAFADPDPITLQITITDFWHHHHHHYIIIIRHHHRLLQTHTTWWVPGFCVLSYDHPQVSEGIPKRWDDEYRRTHTTQ